MGVFRKKVEVRHGVGTSESTITEKYVPTFLTKILVPTTVVATWLGVEASLEKPFGIFKEKEAGIEEKIKEEIRKYKPDSMYVVGQIGYALTNEGWYYVPFWTVLTPDSKSKLENAVNLALSGLPKGNSIIPTEITGTIEEKTTKIYQPRGVNPFNYPGEKIPKSLTEKELERAGYEKEEGKFFSDDYKAFTTTDGKEITVEEMNDSLKVKAKAYEAEYGGMIIYYIQKGSKKKPVYSVQGIVPVKQDKKENKETVAAIRFPTIPGIRWKLGYNHIKAKPA